jgi:hypothetical protein
MKIGIPEPRVVEVPAPVTVPAIPDRLPAPRRAPERREPARKEPVPA